MNVKPKDLAIVVGMGSPEWDGATCTVVKFPSNQSEIGERTTVAGPYWLVEMARPMQTFSLGRQVETMSRDVYLPDSLLRKIAGPDIPTHVLGTEHIERNFNCKCVVKEVQP